MHRLTIIIPAFNEADRLPPNLMIISDYLAGADHWLPCEVIVVDDGSDDGTAPAARRVHLADGIRLSVVSHDGNRGKGAAVRTGFARAKGDELLLCDADLAAPIDQLEVLRRSGDRRSVRLGSRAVDRRLISTPQPRYRDLMGRTFNLAVQALLLRGIHDTQCGFKLFPGDLGRALAGVQRTDGFAFDVELLVLARGWGFRLHEIAVAWRHVEASRVQALRHSGQMARDLLRLWLLRLAGRLPRPPAELLDSDTRESRRDG